MYLAASQVMYPGWTQARGLRGLGDEQETVQDIQVAGGLTATAGTAVMSSIAASGGSVLGLTGATLTAAIPIVGAAIAGITIAVIALAKGCGQTCIVASNYANEAEKLLVQNIQAYFAGPRTKTSQAVALANFDTVWDALQRACQTPALKDAGQRCVTDRQAGACVWRQRSDSPLLRYPGEPQTGQCWNWFSGYRDPIANDPNVVDDSVSAQANSALSQVFGGGASGGSMLPLLLGAGLIVAAVTLL